MANIEDCNFPDDLYYDAENLMWLTFEDDGTVKCGLTDVGQFIAGSLLYVTPRKLGYKAKKGKRVAIIESGKYVGPIKAPLTGEITDLNPKVLKDTGSAKLVNEDPYGEGWILKIKPAKLDEEKDSLLTGDAAMDALKERMARDDWNCREHKGAQA